MALDSKNLILRTASGIVYVGLMIGAVLLGVYGIAILTSLFAIFASYEFEKHTSAHGNDNTWTTVWLVDVAMLLAMIWFSPSSRYLEGLYIIFFTGLFFFRFILQIFLKQNKPLKSISISMFLLFYLGIPLSLFPAWGIFSSPWSVICIIAMIWINDTGAYLVGCTMGRHKMIPRLSPKKSWEGFLGGLLLNIGVAFIYCYYFKLNEIIPDINAWILVGITVSLASTLGDLFESMIKRSLNLKDFGNLIPGHGGILDRIDSLLFVIPAVCLILIFLNIGA